MSRSISYAGSLIRGLFVVGVTLGFTCVAPHFAAAQEVPYIPISATETEGFLVRDRITTQDVAWASNLLGQLTPKQWQDAFAAGAYAPDVAQRFIAKLREKIEQGRSVGARADFDPAKQ